MLKLIARFYRFLLVMLIPVSMLAVIFYLNGQIKTKSDLNNIGKPHFFKAEHYGRVEGVLVKVGDSVEPGKELLGYIITDEQGKTGSVKDELAPVDVTLRQIQGQIFEDAIELPGIVQAFAEVDVTARVGGEIVELNFTEGMKVENGAIIARIDERDYRIALDKAQSAYDLARLQYERLGNLQKKNAISTSTYDDAMANFKIAKANIESARIALERCTIKAPCSGLVDFRNPEVGEIVKSGDLVVRIIDISRVKVNVGIPEQDVDMVRRTSDIAFLVPSLGDMTFNGIVHHISYSSDRKAAVFPMEIHVDNPDGRLLPGMVAKARVIRRIYDSAVLLPIYLVIAGDDEYFTFVMEDGKAVRRTLRLGTMQAKWVHILEGLKPGDMVIEKGLRTVSQGFPVNVVNKEEVR
ncbi:MAG: hypothetical protein CVV64_11750 [Candidatus Wallbacteria bacterium HGW-Wallbacteria-1]|jgi:RND family efflux transporter MFP subunit|uniref:Uncharacterized protein n=1 Tax=Candidatus Wallbacteria bacterium HGW-Wallbacteria-1 TaxID=2013854 RepID=A0A2N1PNR9_9BACT|nr:MAG: hypothetical protein CVV64_11750 [Candidatus Wallbacteria bacterium HGW-Wallbacteria-1]